ncbi:MAG: hypothetical protein IJF38_05780 [Clostridia bacterium]|nr:hypothetical protein [Clostridia bacterium]
MKLVNLKCSLRSEALLSVLSDNERVNRGVIFDEKLGRPLMHIKEKGGAVKIKCELTRRATKDDGFLEGTYFKGRIRDTADGCCVSGVILTAPIFHSIIALLFIVFVVQCFVVGGFTPIPLIMLAFDIVMFYTEFKKQGLIFRYILRAIRRAEADLAGKPADTPDGE